MLSNKNKKIDIEKLLVLFGSGSSSLVIGGFGVYRMMQGELSVAITDFVISAALLVLFVQTFRDQRREYTNLFLVITYTVGIFALLYLKGVGLFYWVYPGIAGTFFLLNVRIALPINLHTIAASMIILLPQLTLAELINIGMSLMLTCMFGYVFSARTDHYNQELSLLATQDPLTKVGNRRSLDERIKEEVIAFQESQQSCSVMILDLDHFKKVNDRFGHAAGDEVLVSFAKILKSSTRANDVIYRYGGEEFVIVSNNMSLESAGKFAEYLRDLVEVNLEVEKHGVTVSIGVSEITEDDSEESWFHRADLALYEAKNANRNKVFLATRNAEQKTYSYRAYKKESKRDLSQTVMQNLQVADANQNQASIN